MAERTGVASIKMLLIPMKSFKERVYELVAKVPKGKVTTYGIIAKQLGGKGARAVGGALHKNEDPSTVPCHRVVNAKGYVSMKFGMGGPIIQVERLMDEGVEVVHGKVDLHEYLYDFSS